MKYCASVLLLALSGALTCYSYAAGGPSPQTWETAEEFFAAGDFNADGKLDLVIVDKETGKYRPAYATNGVFDWVDCRQSGIKRVSGFAIGKFLNANNDSLVFTSPDGTQLGFSDVSSATTPIRPQMVDFTEALGPNMVIGAHVPGGKNDKVLDLFVGSIFNSPDPFQATLLRNEGTAFPKLAELPLTASPSKGTRVTSPDGKTERLWFITSEEKGDTLQVVGVDTGKPVVLGKLEGLATGSEYVPFDGGGLRVIVYKPGEAKLSVHAVTENSGKVTFGAAASHDLGKPIKHVVRLDEAKGSRLFVVFGEGDSSGIFSFDGQSAPKLAQTIVSTNELITCALATESGLTIFSHPAAQKFSTRYLAYTRAGDTYKFNVFGTLPSLADNDNISIPEIHDRIVANLKAKSEAEMKAYTNTIPGTKVAYTMLPIPGGEFMMGSPDNDSAAKPDEKPQHKVKVGAFWMQQCEMTWNQYELFMYPDEEQRMRANNKTDTSGDSLADAVTHPSKPYVEMSFGMGKEGFPAIAMTQHAANKYCQWLSAKTGEFYRLPTEAEWEYACRAGTTTPYFFGTDGSKLKDYAWYEENSDFKYQKVGKKKPNPWGLYDMYGNVTEWVLDQYDPDYYKTCVAQGIVNEPWNKPTKPYPHSVRGGSWDDEGALCRSAVRRGSERAWKMQDPQLPKSVWYFSDAQFVGFRMIRPLKVPPPEKMQQYWSSGTERD
jgi:formylglycine-generating enzyme required for sulfatase activity